MGRRSLYNSNYPRLKGCETCNGNIQSVCERFKIDMKIWKAFLLGGFPKWIANCEPNSGIVQESVRKKGSLHSTVE